MTAHKHFHMILTVVLLVGLTTLPAFPADYYTQNPAGAFHSTTLQESAPVQVVAATFPNGSTWKMEMLPSISTYLVNLAGKPGAKASHEGMDFVHNDPKVPHVPVVAAAKGTVAYVRTGCPQTSMFSRNGSAREAGSGWGNHVVLYHGNGVYTRYAHLAPNSIKAKVGDQVVAGDVVGEMGNSGRSEVRHLHFEVGFKKSYFIAGKPSQSFDFVLDPKKFYPGSSPAKPPVATNPTQFVTDRNNVRSGPSTTDKIIAVALKSDRFKVLERRGEWLKIQLLGTKWEEQTVIGWTHQSNTK
jgi:murein DD-endopeptidase MepM/ murein hydrolase activator NlpD